MTGLVGGPERYTCSRAECRRGASWQITWRNPKIHTADRVKIWLACDEHRDFLRDFLQARSFPVAVRELDVTDPPTAQGPGSS
ncbi:MAG: hypothetical protein ABI255_10065 [Microbacteriaceae bacterium]